MLKLRWKPLTRSALHVSRRALPLLLALLMADPALGSTIHTVAMAKPGPAQAEAAGYDGETIFRGLFFGTGPVAKLFPEIWERAEILAYSHGVSTSPLSAEVQQRIMDRLRGQDPTFFTRFGADLQSGDHLRIRQALENAGRLVLEDVRKNEIATAPAPGPDMGVWVFVVVAAVVAVVWLLAVLYVDVIDVAQGGNSNLRTEMWIDMFAKRLTPANGGGSR